MTIRHNCKKDGCYVDGLPDWSMLNGCFGDTKVSMGDLDGIAHQNGKCLFIEKKFPNGVLEPPQVRMINSLVAQGNSAIAIWCEDSSGKDITLMRVWGIVGYDSERRSPATLRDFRIAVQAWWHAVYVKGKV